MAPIHSAEATGTGKILIVGDSITQGSSGDYTWRYRLWNYLQSKDPGWTMVGTRTDLYDNVNSIQGSPHYATPFAGKAHSAKWGGSLVNEGPDITSQVASTNPDVLVELYGSNDLSFLTNPTQTIANLRTLITNARAAKPGIDIVIGQVLTKWDPWSNTTLLSPEATSYNALLASLATELNTAAQRVVVAQTANGWDPTQHTWDGTHPNSTGETLIAQRVAQALGQMGVGIANPSIFATTTWNVAGPSVSVNAGAEQATISWNRTSTGASGMYLEGRLVNNNSAWQRLPYAISGESWTWTGLVAAATYEFRVAPSKGFMNGTVGPATNIYVPSLPIGSVGSINASVSGAHDISASWSAAANASGYQLAQRRMVNGGSAWNVLPYPVTGTSFTFGILSSGYHYYVSATPVRGYAAGLGKTSGNLRLPGVTNGRIYAALGDSYSSGLGSSLADATSCHRSTNAWAHLLQPDWNHDVKVIACAGAVINDVTANQIDSMNTYFASQPSTGPQLVTLTIGGNDAGFSDILTECGNPYGDCLGGETSYRATIDGLQSRLASLYSNLKSSLPAADIVVGGYPGVLEVEGNSLNVTCQLFSREERALAHRLAIRLNGVISTAAANTGVWSVGTRVYDRFYPGHNACAFSGSWINSPDINIGDGQIVDPSSFHPNNSGQTAYSLAFSDAIMAGAS